MEALGWWMACWAYYSTINPRSLSRKAISQRSPAAVESPSAGLNAKQAAGLLTPWRAPEPASSSATLFGPVGSFNVARFWLTHLPRSRILLRVCFEWVGRVGSGSSISAGPDRAPEIHQ